MRTLRSLLERGTDLYCLRVEPGSDLRDAISSGLGRVGRTFGAARTVELARSGSYDEAAHGGWMDSFPPALWSRREKQLAPPLVVEVDGTDLRPGGLADSSRSFTSTFAFSTARRRSWVFWSDFTGR